MPSRVQAGTSPVAIHRGSLPVAYRLYLPKDWADDPIRRAVVGVPDDVRFQTRPEIALQQMRQALGRHILRKNPFRRRCCAMIGVP
jgi:SRSO17 transposase